MPTTEARNAPAIDACVWRDLAQLAVEALAIGVVFSVLLALAVFVAVRGARGDEFAASPSAPTEIRAPAPTETSSGEDLLATATAARQASAAIATIRRVFPGRRYPTRDRDSEFR